MQGIKRIMPDEFWVDLELIYPTRGGGKKLAEKYKEYGADPGFVCRMAKERGIQAERSTRLVFYRESLKNGHFEAMLREWVPQKGGVKHLAQMFGIPMNMINEASIWFGVHSPGASLLRYHRENLCTDYFNVLNSERAYWLGYIWADGCVVERNGQPAALAISCKRSDEDQILLLRDILNSRHAITHYTEKDDDGNIVYGKNGLPVEKTTVFITSTLIAQTLVEMYGILPRKTYGNPPFPDWLTPELLPHFARGVFDGDGCCWQGQKTYYEGLYQVVYWLGSELFIAGLLEQILEILPVFPATPKPVASIWQISWYSLEDIRLLYRWMYPTPDVICLPRKRDYLQAMLA